jgi:hypothetical protein
MSQYSYSSPSRIKTLDLLAQNKPFLEHSYENLIRYCHLARGQNCSTYSQLRMFLKQRYQWKIEERQDEMEKVWNETDMSHHGSEEMEEVEDDEKLPIGTSEKRVYISIKKDVYSKATLLCQINDPQLQFYGDTGAIGRLSTEESNQTVTVDLKGRQYSGQICPGPTVMFLNMSQPSNRAASSQQTILKVETVTNEYCPLVFEKDLLADLMGSYSGEGMDEMRSNESEEEQEGEKLTERRASKQTKKGKEKKQQREVKSGTKEKAVVKRKRATKKKEEAEGGGEEKKEVSGEESEENDIGGSEKRKKTPTKVTSRSQKETTPKSKEKEKKNKRAKSGEHSSEEDEEEESVEESEEEDESDSDFSQPKRRRSSAPSSASAGIRNPKISTQRVKAKDKKKKRSSKTSSSSKR